MTLQQDFTLISTQTMHHGNCLEIMKSMADNSIDFIVTDPPYGISFMNKGWDHQIPPLDYWKEMLRICKPGSIMACAGLPRMIHRLACIIEDSGWIIRDMIMHLFGQGFPKSHNNFGLDGYGTALKPAWEGWLLCMKPLDGTYSQNAEKWGIGGINIDDSRIGNKGATCKGTLPKKISNGIYGNGINGACEIKELNKGRWPANIILDEEASQLLDQQSGVCKPPGNKKISNGNKLYGSKIETKNIPGINCYPNEIGGASRFFYCAKASSAERGKDNKHPTVKPISLMKYIIKLIAPPNNPTLLDPFAGSGTTLLAAKKLDINAIGIEKEEEYYNTAMARINNN